MFDEDNRGADFRRSMKGSAEQDSTQSGTGMNEPSDPAATNKQFIAALKALGFVETAPPPSPPRPPEAQAAIELCESGAITYDELVVLLARMGQL